MCSGGEAPWLKTHDDVYRDFIESKAAGFTGREAILENVENCRVQVAKLWNTDAARISFAASSTDAMTNLARGLVWRAGDNIVTTALEFPSVGWAWRDLEQQGIEIRRVPHRDWLIDEQDLLEAQDSRTRVMAISQVSFYTGQQLDISLLQHGLRDSETILLVDASHASGAVQVDAPLADVCVASSYKWMLATSGVAPAYYSERAEELIRVSTFGWNNLHVFDDDFATTPQQRSKLKPMPHRFEAGNNALLPIMALGNGVRTILETGIDKIEHHVKSLSEQVSAVFLRHGLEDISPTNFKQRSGNTCFRHRHADTVMHQLAEQGILVWGGDGRLRVSTHLYNGSDDVARLDQVLSSLDLT